MWKTDGAGCRFDSQTQNQTQSAVWIFSHGVNVAPESPVFSCRTKSCTQAAPTLKNRPDVCAPIVTFSLSVSNPQCHRLCPQTLWPICCRPLFIWAFQFLFITPHAPSLIHSPQHSASARPSVSLRAVFLFLPWCSSRTAALAPASDSVF